MQTFVADQMGREVFFNIPPRRIVSLVPSQTELLNYLGLDEEVVGITKFCIHPGSWLKTKTKVGGTKNFSLEKIIQLNPDLVIGNKEENILEGISILEKKVPVWMSDISNLSEALWMIRTIGNITCQSEKANELATKIEAEASVLSKSEKKFRVLYLIWQNPFMAAGHQTFINDLLTNVCGFENALPPELTRYPQLSENDMKTCRPDLVLLSSEPYPFKQKHIPAIQMILPHTRILPVNGEMFSWYGSRLLLAIPFFHQLIADINSDYN
ncbi:MAG: ABC transporter substrate-binding protein [Sphingobacteriales bacterium]|nr:MAG: ABC transporter substrate-binding protein [Sphingobacteriales bacterium]